MPRQKRLGHSPLNEVRSAIEAFVTPAPPEQPRRLCEKCADSKREPQCAFTRGNFSGENWCCRSLRALWWWAHAHNTVTYSLDHSLAILPIPHQLSELDEILVTHVFLHRYKDRGRTQVAHLVAHDGTLRTLDRRTAELLAAHFSLSNSYDASAR